MNGAAKSVFVLEVGGSDGNSGDRAGRRGATTIAVGTADEVGAARGLAQLVMGSGYQAPNYGVRYSQEGSKRFFVKNWDYERISS